MAWFEISKIILHCSDSPDSLDIGVNEIREWHTAAVPYGRGWNDIGYHYVVRRNGTVEVGRYQNGDSVLEGKEIGAHVRGNNSDSLAICWVGKKQMSKEQRHSILKLISNLMAQHSIGVNKVYGHYEFDSSKTCPNINMDDFRSILVQYKAMS